MTRREWLAALHGMAVGLAGLPVVGRAQIPSGTGDPTALSIAELSRAFTTGRLTPLDVTAAYLTRIDERDGSLRAYITVARDRAVDETRRLLARGAGPEARGPLFGVPIAHKDLFLTRGVRTTGGSKLYETRVPDEDADLIARFAAAGAVMLGKTNTHELGGGVTTINPFFGTTRNPHDPTRIPGGSSGGSAAAVAARLTLVATGSDTGGSIRIPAAFCGCVGVKPTFGLLPTTGLLGACPTFDHVGLITRTAEDAAIALGAVAPTGRLGTSGRGVLDSYRAAVARGVRGLRVGVPRAYFFEALEPGVARAIAGTLDGLRAAGAIMREIRLPVDDGLYDTMFTPIAVSEIRATYAGDWKARPEAFSKDFAEVFEGPRPSDATVANALATRQAFERSVVAAFEGVDVLAMPTVPVVAPLIAGPIDGLRILRNTWAFNAARVPAVSVPCGTGDHGLPVGLQLVARPFGEGALLGVATIVERLAMSA